MSNTVLRIKIFDKDGTQVLNLGKSAVTIGSAPHSDVVLGHGSVHPEHARAWLEGGRVWVQDLGGKSGTFLNGVRLPALKPMLVRELDTLRTGECEASLGLELNYVRSPVVKTKTNITIADILAPEDVPPPREAPPVTKNAPLKAEPAKAQRSKTEVPSPEVQHRKEELEKLARDLADIRRHLQMAKMERKSDADMTTQLNRLRDELKSIQEQRSKVNERIQQLESERHQLRQEHENYIRESQIRSVGEKKESMLIFARHLRGLSSKLVKRWTTRPLSQDMIFEWESETLEIFKDVAMLDVDDIPPMPALPALPAVTSSHHDEEHTSARFEPPPEPTVRVLPRTSEITGTDIKIRERRRRRGDRPRSFRKVIIAVVGVGTFMALMYFGVNWVRESGMSSLSSRESVREAQATEVRTPATPTRYIPKQNRKYRTTYTDNVLYFESYVDAEQNPEFHKLWLSEFKQVANTDWKLSDPDWKAVVAKEESLIRDLAIQANSLTVEHEAEGKEKMRLREAGFIREIEGHFKGRASVEKFLAFKRSFFAKYQSYLKKETL
jgi:hypothetical protein